MLAARSLWLCSPSRLGRENQQVAALHEEGSDDKTTGNNGEGQQCRSTAAARTCTRGGNFLADQTPQLVSYGLLQGRDGVDGANVLLQQLLALCWLSPVSSARCQKPGLVASAAAYTTYRQLQSIV